jgi:hypothetical protein
VVTRHLSTRACELTHWKNLFNIDVLATAYAEAGDFSRAIKFEKKAIDEIANDEDVEQVDDRRERLKLFEQRKPYHEPPPKD